MCKRASRRRWRGLTASLLVVAAALALALAPGLPAFVLAMGCLFVAIALALYAIVRSDKNALTSAVALSVAVSLAVVAILVVLLIVLADDVG